MTDHTQVTRNTSLAAVAGSIRQAIRTLAGQSEHTPEPVAPGDPDDPTCFQDTDEGSGVFGHWKLDDTGLPAYQYEIDQYAKLAARYPNTEGIDRRDHWHQIGNDRVTALTSNDGIVQLYLADRGGVFLNRYEVCDDDPPLTPIGYLNRWLRAILGYFSRVMARRLLEEVQRSPGMAAPRGAAVIAPLQRAMPLWQAAPKRDPTVTRYTYGGGFGYVDDGQETWSTAYRYRPAGSDGDVSRRFGIGYYETEIRHRHVRVNRRTYAPHGQDPLLLTDVIVENQGDTALDLRYYEYWDVNVLQLKLDWLRTGLFAPPSDALRHQINKRFAPGIALDYGQQALRFHQRHRDDVLSSDDEVSGEVDPAPSDVFLADLTDQPNSWYVDKFAFFGKGGARKPDAIQARRDGELDADSKIAMPYCMVFRRDLHLEPKQSVSLRFAYGAVRPGESLAFLDAYQTGEPFLQTMGNWRSQLVYFSTGSDPALQREMAWHAANLLTATVYSEFYGVRLTPQGSAYLYLHGADGAPRDQALFTIPLVYVRPDLAREVLQLIMSMTHADTHAIPYSFAGNGYQSDATIHAAPSDLDLFFLLAVAEYLSASGDLVFLDSDVPFYRPGPPPTLIHGASVLDHIRAAFCHLMECVRIGEHGLIRIGDGDWSDGVVVSAILQCGADYFKSCEKGESIPNSQMALHVLPLIAAVIRPRDPALADAMLAPLPDLRAKVMCQWIENKGWFARAVLRDVFDNSIVLDKDRINLEAQPWALIGDLAACEGKEPALVKSIQRNLDQPIGTTLVPGGQVWPAISQLLTWGYTRHYPNLAWESLKRNTFMAHATVYPKVWYNIWSGPDGICTGRPTPGFAWASEVTPMTDFPVMNANQDAMALLALLRVCGIEPACTGKGLIIAPKAPPARFVLETRLLRLDVQPGRIAGEYRAFVDGSLTLYVHVPDNVIDITATLDGQPGGVIPISGAPVEFPLTFMASQLIRFEVTWEI